MSSSKGVLAALATCLLIGTILVGPVANATPAPGTVCTGYAATECWFCSGNGGQNPASSNNCLDDYWSGYYWYHCSVWLLGACTIG